MLYVFMSVSTILGYFIAISHALDYGTQLVEMGGSIRSDSLVGKMSGYLGAIVYSAVVYFLAKTKPDAENT